MKSLSTSDAREHFSEIVNQVAYGKQRQIISRRGKALIAIIPIEELKILEKLENQQDLKDAKDILAEPRKTKSWKKIKNESDLV